MTIPDRINARWIATLGDEQLVRAEATLHADFREKEIAAKKRAGGRYVLLEGPAPLVSAWLRWLLVSNATRDRGLTANHPR